MASLKFMSEADLQWKIRIWGSILRHFVAKFPDAHLISNIAPKMRSTLKPHCRWRVQ